MDARAQKINGIARKLGLPADVVVRDLLQAKLLGAIFANSTSRALAIKGGFAMRLAAGSTRMTKDIDLQSDQALPMRAVKGIIETAIKDALGSGLLENVKFAAPKQTETVQRWKINGTVPGGQSNVHLTIEVSRRGHLTESMTQQVSVDDPENGSKYLVESFTPQMLAAGKTLAVVSANRVAVRDIFDLDVLISMKVEPAPEILDALGAENLQGALNILWDKLEMMDWKMAQQDLLPSLPREVAERLDEQEWEAMRLRVGTGVEHWLQQAKGRSLQ